MEILTSRAFSALATRSLRSLTPAPWLCSSCRISNTQRSRQERAFTSAQSLAVKKREAFQSLTDGQKSYTQPAAETSQDVAPEESRHYGQAEEESKQKQRKSPWMRSGSDDPPVSKIKNAGNMTKGKLLTTPSRMLKLILPLRAGEDSKEGQDVEPLALLVHPQQPLSYLERLIQSELPMMNTDDKPKIPTVTFRAQDSGENDVSAGSPAVDETDDKEEKKRKDNQEIEKEDAKKTAAAKEDADTVSFDGTAVEDRESAAENSNTLIPPREEQQSDEVSEDPNRRDFVRWSPSTEIGDFIRDAARGKEFAIDIEGHPNSVLIGVPSFADRTFYLRMRLRKTAKRILDLADIKSECDRLAHRSAQRVAQGGFAGLIGWWGLVYYLTFKTDYGWDVMEPVTYLVGLTTLMGGYMWFLYHNREVSYRSAMALTISRRQAALYEEKGFNLSQWEGLVEEANRLRREIKLVADEYDVDWDEIKDEHDDKVAQALRQERKKEKGNGGKKKEDDKDDDDDD